MGLVHIDNVRQGMVLGADARDVNSRLLLSKGLAVSSEHIRIFKIWGVTEILVNGNDEPEDSQDAPPDSKRLEAARNQTLVVFKNLDPDHPAIRELFRFSVKYRAMHGSVSREPEPLPVLRESQDDPVSVDVTARIRGAEVRLPEIPSIVFELNEIAASPYASAGDVGGVVNKSPSLTTLLLRIVNSAFYGFPSKIDSVSRAVTLIGSKEIAGLALGISVMKVFRDIPENVMDMHSFLRHSLACGTIARILAAHRNMKRTEQMFVAGLLHDIGRLIVYKYFPDQAKALLAYGAGSGRSLYELERRFLGCRHTETAAHLLSTWRFPFALGDTVAFHHEPSLAKERDEATIVHLADIIANALGLGTSGERVVPGFDYEAWERLGMSPSIFTVVVRQAVHQLGSVERLFGRDGVEI